MLTEVGALITICRAAIEAGRAFKKSREDRLSEEEKQILRSGAHSGLFQIMPVESILHVVNLESGRPFADEPRETGPDDLAGTMPDPMVAAKYLDAFESLCRRGLFRHQSDDLFQLTGTGFTIARELAAGSFREDQ